MDNLDEHFERVLRKEAVLGRKLTNEEAKYKHEAKRESHDPIYSNSQKNIGGKE